MTTTPNNESLPDSISMADLQSMMDQAKSNEPDKTAEEPKFEGLNESEVCKLAEELMNAADKKCPHPVLAKVVMMMICHRMISWHSGGGAHIAEDSKCEDDSYIHWLRDAGKFQAIAGILGSISVCEDDFTYKSDESDE